MFFYYYYYYYSKRHLFNDYTKNVKKITKADKSYYLRYLF